MASVVCRQVFDIPAIRVRVTEHRLVERRCHCGKLTRAAAPAGVRAPTQYGPHAAAIGVYLYTGQFLSRQRTADALSELFATPVSAGTVSAWTARAADAVDSCGLTDRVRAALAAAPVAHFDETGLRVAGRLHWVHSASTGEYSLISVHPKRGRVAMDAAGVLPGFTGVAVHDAWAPYDTYTTATHALCNAHLLRELVAVIEQSVVSRSRRCCVVLGRAGTRPAAESQKLVEAPTPRESRSMWEHASIWCTRSGRRP